MSPSLQLPVARQTGSDDSAKRKQAIKKYKIQQVKSWRSMLETSKYDDKGFY